MRDGFKVEGVASVVRALGALGLEVEDLKDAFGAIAAEAAQVAASYAPRLSGALAGDIRGNRAKSKAVVISGRARIPYAGPINYGWRARNITGAYFMQRADQTMRPRAIQRLETEVNKKIREKSFQ